MKNKKTVVIYHGNCPDGIGGAWAAWKRFGARAEYIPMRRVRGEKTPAVRGKEIYMIDFTLDAATIKRFLKENKKVTAIDHHISAEIAVKLTENYSYDKNRSGAALAWKYFHPKKPMPRLLRYIEDCDLWRFELPHSKEISAALGDEALSFKNLDAIVRRFKNASFRKKFIARGKIVLAHDDALIREVIRKGARRVLFAGRKTFAVNSPLFSSEIGHMLARKNPPLGIVWAEEKEGVKVSLRSDGSVDVSKIAAKFGGGGHRAAAGFSLPRGKRLPWKYIG